MDTTFAIACSFSFKFSFTSGAFIPPANLWHRQEVGSPCGIPEHYTVHYYRLQALFSRKCLFPAHFLKFPRGMASCEEILNNFHFPHPALAFLNICNGVQREHNKKLNNGLPILHKVPPKRDYGRYFCIIAEKGGTSHGGLTEKLSLFFHAKKQEVNAYGR